MQATMAPGGSLVIGVPRETVSGERRVALIPDTVTRLVGQGLRVVIERDAGQAALYPDQAYVDAGATIAPDAAAVYRESDVICKVQRPAADPDAPAPFRPGQILISFLASLNHPEDVRSLADAGVTAFGMEAIPRTTRAQAMDALSSQSNLAGYKAVVLAADHLGKLFPLLMTAAGTIAPSRVLVIGAGVAGLQAIATARRLGAVVEAYDTRPVVKEQVQSLGATFVEVPGVDTETQDTGGYAKEVSAETLARQQAALADRSAKADVIITTALVPGRPAPRLISAETVAAMRPGSVIVDLASEAGGNCELTRHGETVVEHDVVIIGPRNLPADVPTHASQMYARNVQSLIGLIVRDGALALDFSDDIIAAACLTHDGEIRYGPTRTALGLPPLTPTEPEPGPEPAPSAANTAGAESDRADLSAVPAASSSDLSLTRNGVAGAATTPTPADVIAIPARADDERPEPPADEDPGGPQADEPSLLERASAWISDTPVADRAPSADETDTVDWAATAQDPAPPASPPYAGRSDDLPTTGSSAADYGETGLLTSGAYPLAGESSADDVPEAPRYGAAVEGDMEDASVAPAVESSRGAAAPWSTDLVSDGDHDVAERKFQTDDAAIPLAGPAGENDPLPMTDIAAVGDQTDSWSNDSDVSSGDPGPTLGETSADALVDVVPGDAGLAPHELAYLDDLASAGPAEARSDTPDEVDFFHPAGVPDDAIIPLDQAPDVVSTTTDWASDDDGSGMTIHQDPEPATYADSAPYAESADVGSTTGEGDQYAGFPPESDPSPQGIPWSDVSVEENSTGTDDPRAVASTPDASDTSDEADDPTPGGDEPSTGRGPLGKGRPAIPPWRRR